MKRFQQGYKPHDYTTLVRLNQRLCAESCRAKAASAIVARKSVAQVVIASSHVDVGLTII